MPLSIDTVTSVNVSGATITLNETGAGSEVCLAGRAISVYVPGATTTRNRPSAPDAVFATGRFVTSRMLMIAA
jgi:hypothetical protein